MWKLAILNFALPSLAVFLGLALLDRVLGALRSDHVLREFRVLLQRPLALQHLRRVPVDTIFADRDEIMSMSHSAV